MDTSKPIEPWHIVAATPAEIAKLTHRHVHILYDRWRNVGFRASYDDLEYGFKPDEHELVYIKATAILKAELARRPHVPNKKESKALRQAAAKAGR